MRFTNALLAGALVLAVPSMPASAQDSRAARFVRGEILVKFRPGAAPRAVADAHRQGGGTVLNLVARTGVQLVGVAPGDEGAAIARYRRNPSVQYAEPNFVRRIPAPLSHTPGSEIVPGDYYFDEQWALHNTGQPFYCIAWIGGDLCFYVGTADADIDAPEAWAVTTGGSAVRVAVIDSGIDYRHPDLAANFAGGADFVFNDGDPMDDHGHGTHVSGTIAAAMSNLTGDPAAEEGVVGVAPHAGILAYKVCRSDGTCSDFAIEQAIAQAILDGARVINMSLGGPDFSQSMSDAVQDAWTSGLVVVAAAGNDGSTGFSYPAAYDNVVSVAAFDEDHRQTSFTNYGSWVDLSAPGNVIMSTYPLSACGGGGTVPGDVGCYTWLSGTSMASPHVAGAAALVWSRPDVTSNAQVVDLLLNSADPRGVAATRLDSWTIHGGLNVHDALSYGVTNAPPVAANASVSTTAATPVAILLGATDAGTCELAFSIVQPPDAGTLGAIEDQACVPGAPNSDSARVTYTPPDAAGTYSFTYTASDGSAESNVATVTIAVSAVEPPPAPQLSVTGIDPSLVSQRAGTVRFVISGTGFVQGAGVAFVNGTGPAPRVLSVTWDGGTQLTASVEIPSGGPRRNRVWDVRVTNPDGTSATGVGLLTIAP